MQAAQSAKAENQTLKTEINGWKQRVNDQAAKAQNAVAQWGHLKRDKDAAIVKIKRLEDEGKEREQAHITALEDMEKDHAKALEANGNEKDDLWLQGLWKQLDKQSQNLGDEKRVAVENEEKEVTDAKDMKIERILQLLQDLSSGGGETAEDEVVDDDLLAVVDDTMGCDHDLSAPRPREQISASRLRTRPATDTSLPSQPLPSRPRVDTPLKGLIRGRAIDWERLPATVGDDTLKLLADNPSYSSVRSYNCIRSRYKNVTTKWNVIGGMDAACYECTLAKLPSIRNDSDSQPRVLPLVEGERLPITAAIEREYWVLKDSVNAIEPGQDQQQRPF
jgi:hypothetical protein